MTQTKPTFEGYFLSPQQTRVWNLYSQNGGSLQSNYILRLQGDFSAREIARALENIVRRQESLRSGFQKTPEFSTPLQIINPDADFIWREIGTEKVETIFDELKKVGEDLDKLQIVLAQPQENEFLLGISLSALVCDIESANVLAKEIFDELTNGDKTEVISAVQYSALQNELLTDDEDASARMFWRDEMSKINFSTPPLAAKNVTPNNLSLAVKSCDLAEFKQNLETISNRLEAETKDILLTAWTILAARFSGEDSVTILNETDGRIYGELENLVSRCAKKLPLNFSFGSKIRVADLIEKINERREDAENYQEGFDSANCLEKIISFGFAFHELKSFTTKNFAAEVVAVSKAVHEANLNLRIIETGEKLFAELVFNREFLAESLAEEMLRSFVLVVEQLCENPQIVVSEIEILSKKDAEFLQKNENLTKQDFPFKTLSQMFSESAAVNKNQTAVISDETLSFAEFERKVKKLANFLLNNQVQREEVIAVLFPHGADALAAMLAISSIGAAYLPLEVSMPKERIEYILADSKAKFLLTESNLATNPAAENLQILAIDKFADEIDSMSDFLSEIVIEPQQNSYIIYTSGSTGKPKGVAVTHEGLSNYLQWARNFYRGNADCGAPLHSSVAFDMAVTSCFVPLLNGKSVCLTSEITAENPASLLKVWKNGKSFDFVKLTPAHSKLLGANLEKSEAGKAEKLILGGEALTVSDIGFFRENAPETQIINEYGPTETVVGCALFADFAKNLSDGNIPIGLPIANTQIYVLDAQMRQVPRGVIGEIYIGGKGVARGYVNQPALTAERFVPDSFSNDGARLYPTGDLAIRREDGNLIFLGRNDSQIKVRGFRVEPGEIETALLEIENVGQSAAIVKTDAENRRNIYAFVVLNDKTKQVSAGNLREILAQKLPAPMIPANILILDALPLNQNGKIDRRKLSELLENQMENGYVAPRTLEEEILTGIWSQVLNVANVGIDDSYTALGGDSIRSLQIISRAEERGLKVSIARLLKLQTIRRIAAEIKHEKYQPEQIEREPFSLISNADKAQLQDEFSDAYPLSQLQAGMVFHRELNPESAVYHDVFGYHVKAPLNPEKMRKAIAELIKRHPVLRTSFDLANYETPLQIVHRNAEMPLTVEDISDLEIGEQEKVLEAFLTTEKTRDFDLKNPPLLRFHIHVRSAETFQFWLSFHHAIIDGWTDISMLVELALSYQELLAGKEISVQTPRAFYRDFIELELAELVSEESRGFWEQQLKDAPVMHLPREILPSAELPEERGSLLVPVEIPAEISDRLRELAKAAAVPIKNVLLTAHQFVMSFLSGNTDVLTTLTAVGRPETIDGDKVFGLHLNSMPFRQKLAGGTWRELIAKVFETEREALPYRRFPMAELQRINGGIAPAETLFYFTHYYNVLDLAAFPEMEVFDWYGYEETSFTLSAHFSIEPQTSRVLGNLDADQTQLSEIQVRKFAAYYARTLAEMATNPNNRYEIFSPLNEAEKNILLSDFAKPKKGISAGEHKFVSQMILEKAKETPESVALIFGETQITYGELFENSLQLAETLKNRGIGAESVVAIALKRSPEMIVSILATMLAGAAYLPIDTNYPPERKAFMLSDSRADLLLTSKTFAETEKFETPFLFVEDANIFRGNAAESLSKVEPENAAYIIYTSGSTGTPKGVVVSQNALTNHTVWAREFYELTGDDRVLQFASVGFDVLAEETFPTLAAGASLVLWSEERAVGAREFFDFIEREKITVVNLPAAYWHELVSELENNLLQIPACLRQIIVGSDTVAAEKLKIWRKLFPEKPALNNSYGLTETTITSTVFEIQSDENPEKLDFVPIGKPTENVEVYVLDAEFRPVPVGVVGEIFIGGKCVARGYFGQPALTAEKFVPHLFSTEAGARLYRTGDLAVRREDGNLIFLGRADEQIKLRGFRIETGEIENALLKIEGVDSVAVIVSISANGEKSLNAFIESSHNSYDANDLRANLRRKLPEYMIPSNIRLMEKLPLNANGKIDRKALQIIEFASKEITENYVEPRNDAEFVLAKICAEVLEKERVGVNMNFFELGGHSLLAVRFTARIRSFFQVELPLSALYENPTIEGIAGALANKFGGTEKLNEVAAIIRQVLEMSETEASDLLNKN